MSECAVGLGHTVHIFLTLEGTTLFVESVHDFGRELVSHSLATTLAGEGNHILHGY